MMPERFPLKNTLLVGIALSVIILLGGYFRFLSLNWDDFASLHPDERFLTRNLLPLVGGNLEFTTDAHDFPNHFLIVGLNNMSLENDLQVRGNPILLVGAVKGTLAAETVSSWLGDSQRLRVYETETDAIQGIANADVAAILMESTKAQPYVNAGMGIRVLQTFESPLMQQYYCNAQYPETGGVGGYFDTQCSSWNPNHAGQGFFAYGTFPVFLARVVSNFIIEQENAGTPFFDFQGETLVWRFLSAFFDVGTIIVIFFIGRRLHGNRVGLIAAFLYACAPLAIEKAHFGTVNAITNFFVTLALWAAVMVQDKGRFFHYTIFGIALGIALAGRINVIPLAGIVVLAGMLNAAPILDKTIPWYERERLLWRNIIGVFIAGFFTILIFRLVNPYAFTGPTFFHLIPSHRFLDEAQQSSANVSGNVDSPPNWQWLNRAPYLFPLKDMLLWGLGLASGALSWLGFLWSGYQIARGRRYALRNLLLFTWVLVYFGWIGKLWVMTMRYYLPLYGALVLLGAWAIVELARQAQIHKRDVPLTRFTLGGLGGFFLAVPAYALYAQISLSPTLISSGIAGGALLLIAILPIPKRAYLLGAFVLSFSLLWAFMYTNIYRQQVPRVQAARWVWENVSGDLSAEIEGAPEGTPLVNIAFRNRSSDGASQPDKMISLATNYAMSRPYMEEFTALASGTIRSFHAPHLADPLNDPESETFYVSISRMDGNTPILLAEATLTQNFPTDSHPLGASYDIVFPESVAIEAGQRYLVKAELLTDDFNDALVGSGAVMSTEGDWDDRITTIMMCELAGYTLADNLVPGMASYDECNGRSSYYALLQSYDIAMSYPEDNQLKLKSILDGLAVGDYFGITSNRFYDTEARNPARFPLTTRFYDLLFAGELGYELVADFSADYELGFLSVSDQNLPTYNTPDWLNELEADEAFHVYDHPAVFVFRKSADYDQERVNYLLGSVPIQQTNQIGASQELGAILFGSVYWATIDADEAPTALQLTAEMRETQESGGTWSERFDSASILNTNQFMGVMVWWFTLTLIGLITFPILFTAFPRLADRGYGFAKIIGLLLVGWTAWVLSSFNLAVWNQLGLGLLLLLLALLSISLASRQREALQSYLTQHWKRLAAIELISLVLFLAWVGVRLTNPDLWHHPMGGEKPMDFAYFNAVLRSTIFPAYDPWYAGGYINYYYVGYVLVGVPVLLLKIVPAFAYNLIVPTLFSLTGIAAFSVAFNITDSWRSRQVVANETEKIGYTLRMGNPWLAGIIALMLCVVLGNLDVPRVLITEGIARIGGYTRPQGIEQFFLQEYQAKYGIAAEGNDQLIISEQAKNPNIVERLRYEISIGLDMWGSFFEGLPLALSGQTLPIGSNRWYWAPTRIMNETPGIEGNAINEMPSFTFIYADLHAHMINMPLMLFALLFIFYEVQVAQADERRAFAVGLALFLGGLSIGLMRAINTWDFPSFMLLAMVGLGYAWWQRWQGFSRASLLHILVFMGAFLTFALWTARPYTEWYASVYNSAELWKQGKTPFWAYFDIYGLFLFLIVSLLIWETGRWLRETRVRTLNGQMLWLSIGFGTVVLVLLASLIAAMFDYQVALIVAPLLLWIGILFFREGQSEAMRYILVLAGFALSITLGVEVIVLSGDIGRQNTVFKFYIQAWILLSVVGGVAFAWLMQAAEMWSIRWRILWYIPVMSMFAISAMFPVMAIRARMLDRFSPDVPLTLNGLDYMPYAQHWLLDYGTPIQLESDYHLIRWLQEEVQGTPTIMEGRSLASEYRYNGRISINTGLPAVLGWNWHQRQQRTLNPLTQFVEQRERNIQFFYNTTDITSAAQILQAYDVRYVIVSDMEQSMYPPDALFKFEMMLVMDLFDIAYEYENSRIYTVNTEALSDYLLHQKVFFDALDLGSFSLFPYEASQGLNDLHQVDETLSIGAALHALADYEMPYIVVYNLPQLQAYAPPVYDRIIKLENLGALEIMSDTLSRRIYRVNQERVQSLVQTED